jgi:hypothetical protein
VPFGRTKERGKRRKEGTYKDLCCVAFILEPLTFSLCLVPHFSHESLMDNGVYQKVRKLHVNGH